MSTSDAMTSPSKRRGLAARTIVAVAAAAALIVVLPSAGAGAHAEAATSTTTASTDALAAHVDLARLSITVTTTSDWAKVHLSPANARYASVAGNPVGVTATKISDGIAVANVPVAGATVTFEVLAEDLTGATSFTASVEKGQRGTATATVVNHSATPYNVVRISDINKTTTPVSTSLARGQLFGTVEPTLPHADARHLVLAFYYGWYGRSSFDSPRMFDQPASGPYSSWDSTAVMNMTAQARANGIDGFVESWAGNDHDGAPFDVALSAAGATGGYATGYLETTIANAQRDDAYPADPAVVRSWLDELLTRSSNPAFLSSDGVPVVFVYGMYRLPPSTWAQILADEAATGHPVRLVGDGSLPSYANVMWGSHIYNPNQQTYDQLSSWDHGRLVAERGPASVNAAIAPKLYAATVSPGFDNRNAKAVDGQTGTYVPRGTNGERYQLTWDAARHNDPDWVLVTTWNEWYEGTAIQPGLTTGTMALEQTKANAALF